MPIVSAFIHALDATYLYIASSTHPAFALTMIGAVTGIGSILIHTFLTRNSGLEDLNQQIKDLRSELLKSQDDFSVLTGAISRLLRMSCRRVVINVVPSLIAFIPVFPVLLWAIFGLTYDKPAANHSLQLTIQSGTSVKKQEIRWPPQENDIDTELKDALQPMVGHSHVIPESHKRHWWNLLIPHPGGYIQESSAIDRVDASGFSETHLFPDAPRWAKTWHFWLLGPMFVFSLLALKPFGRYWQSRQKRQQRTSRPRSMIPLFEHVSGELVARTRSIWVSVGNFETDFFEEKLAKQRPDSPIFITGVARAGTTIILEKLARHPHVGSLQYNDLPFLYTPLIWDLAMKRRKKTEYHPVERAHKDRILITPTSPEALEEPLWMAFFHHLHQTNQSQVLDESTSNPDFEVFYRNEIRKILFLRQRPRYVSKANYNITRMRYLHKIFPEAVFLLIVRNPLDHISSLIKQHKLFQKLHHEDPRTLAQFQRIGHYEFGLDRRPINAGNRQRLDEIIDDWSGGREVPGWAKYWSYLYDHALETLASSPKLASRVRIVQYENICRNGFAEITAIMQHCNLDPSAVDMNALTSDLCDPTYYSQTFTDSEIEQVARITSSTAARIGSRPVHSASTT